MKYSDLAPESGQNDIQLVMFQLNLIEFRAFYMEIQKEGSQNFEALVYALTQPYQSQ